MPFCYCLMACFFAIHKMYTAKHKANFFRIWIFLLLLLLIHSRNTPVARNKFIAKKEKWAGERQNAKEKSKFRILLRKYGWLEYEMRCCGFDVEKKLLLTQMIDSLKKFCSKEICIKRPVNFWPSSLFLEFHLKAVNEFIFKLAKGSNSKSEMMRWWFILFTMSHRRHFTCSLPFSCHFFTFPFLVILSMPIYINPKQKHH